ncbi:MAG: hypothetical protein DRP71_15025 [Verrucomicrobia bacterium]|nr:MAG: hypothetical protein DRP71_15025 [Verrucomicrobiota bacterium]
MRLFEREAADGAGEIRSDAMGSAYERGVRKKCKICEDARRNQPAKTLIESSWKHVFISIDPF